MNILFLEDEDYYRGIISSEWLARNASRIEFSGARYYKRKFSFFRKFAAVVSIQYLWPLCNLVICKAKAAGVKTVLFTDGIVEWENCLSNPHVLESSLKLYRPIIHDVFACPGLLESRLYSGCAQACSFIPEKMYPINFDKKKSKDFATERNRILLTSANNPYFSDSERNRLVSLIREIICNAEQEIVLRFFDRSLIDFEEASGLRNDTETPFNELLEQVDAVISTPSSVVLTAMLADIPTCQIIYRDCPIHLQSGWSIHLSCDIKVTLDSLISADSERMEFQRQVVAMNYSGVSEDQIFSNGANACARMPDIDFIYNNSLARIVESPFNFNFEMFARRIYRKIKKAMK